MRGRPVERSSIRPSAVTPRAGVAGLEGTPSGILSIGSLATITDGWSASGAERTHLATVTLDLPGHEREQPLGVGVALHQRPVSAELTLEVVETTDDAVVREEPAALGERMRVAVLDRPGRRVADVGHERRRLELPGIARERLVLAGGERLLGDVGETAGVEASRSRAVGRAATLLGEAVRRLEQPEGRAHSPLPYRRAICVEASFTHRRRHQGPVRGRGRAPASRRRRRCTARGTHARSRGGGAWPRGCRRRRRGAGSPGCRR